MSSGLQHHPRDGEAFEYVLGTGSAEERHAFARDMERDPALAAAVRFWEERTARLADGIPPVAPSPELFAAIERRATGDNVTSLAAGADLLRLRRSRAIWRAVAAGAGSLAAALALYVAVNRGPAVAPPSDLVAVVNRSGDLPALIVRVDQRSGTVQIRSVAAEAPPDRSLELWSIAPGETPRSLGVIGQGTTRASLPAGQSAVAPELTLAVTVEPPGGSPTGVATGPIVYTGKLIREER